jgi:hypothetical protein
MGSIFVLDPTSGTIEGENNLAPRLSTLEGKVLAVVNNGKRNSDVLLKQIATQIKEKYRLKDVLWIEKKNASLPMTDSDLEKLKTSAHAVISGVGD